jgi:hypothetical protein
VTVGLPSRGECLERRKETAGHRARRLGSFLRRIQRATRIRRETAATCLKAAACRCGRRDVGDAVRQNRHRGVHRLWDRSVRWTAPRSATGVGRRAFVNRTGSLSKLRWPKAVTPQPSGTTAFTGGGPSCFASPASTVSPIWSCGSGLGRLFMLASQFNRSIKVYGDGKQVRDILFIAELLDTCDAAFAAGDIAVWEGL